MKKINRILVIILVIFPIISFARSIYYYEDFGVNQSTLESRGWTFNFPMSRDMIIYDWYNSNGWATTAEINFPGTNYVSGGRLWLRGQPNNISGVHNTIFCGDGVVFYPQSNSSIGQVNATEEEPFGYTIIRYTTSIDAFSSYQDSANEFPQGIANMVGYVSTWLAEDNGVTKYSTNSRWNNFAFFFDKGIKREHPNTWGYYNNIEWLVPFNTITNDIDNKTVGIISNYFQSQYDDMDANHYNSYDNGYRYPVTNELGINMVHSGNKITIYINPDPAGNTSNLSNTWIKFAEFPVSWSNKVIAYFNNETPYYRIEPIEAQFDNFLIRTVASNITAKMIPNKVITNQWVDFKLEINVENVSANDSGVGEIYIKKPASYGSWDINSISVSNIYGVLTRRTSGTPGNGEFLVMDKGNELHIRFFMQNANNNNIVRTGKIAVGFRARAPQIPNGRGENFEVYVDCRKHSDTGIDWIFDNANGIKYATTGRKKAKPVSDGDLTVKVYTFPAAYATLQVNPMVIGQEEQSVTLRLDGAGEDGRPDINYFMIYIPSGFTVSNNNKNTGEMNIVSTKILLNRSVSNIYLTNLNGSNFIFIDYMPNGFDGVYGFDMINFNVYGTPPLPENMLFSNFSCPVYADSSLFLGGATWTRVDTNSFIKVTVSNANAVGYVYPSKVTINSSISLNTNRYKYYIRNLANPGNDIKKLRIKIPANFDVVSGVVSSNGVASYSNGYVWVDYGTRYLAGKEIDIVEFNLRHTNTNVNSGGEYASLILEADNGNSLGYVEQQEDAPKTWTVFISPPIPEGENKLEPALIYVSDITNEITNTIVNLSSRDVDVKMVKISLSTNYVDKIISVNSLLIGNNYSLTTNQGNLNIYLNYQNNGTNLLSWYKDSNALDRVIIKFVDKIRATTFTQMPTNILVPTYLYKVNYETNNTNFFGLSSEKSDGTNVLWVEYPSVRLDTYISPKLIDSTTITNRITMYLTNFDNPDNRIKRIYITFPTNVTTNIINLSLSGGGGVTFNKTYNRIELNFESPYQYFDGKTVRTLSFDMIDNIENMDLNNVPILPSVLNDRGWEYNITNGNSYLTFMLPKPKGGGGVIPSIVYIGRDSEVITQTIKFYVTNGGVGTDAFNRVRIDIPAFLRQNIMAVYSSKLNLWSTNSSAFSFTSSNFILNYGTNKLRAGEVDEMWIILTNGNRELPASGSWRIFADNGFVDLGTSPPTYFFEITNVTIGSRVSYATRPLNYDINGAFYTTDTRKMFEINFKNGETGNVPVKRAGVVIPEIFTINAEDIVVSGYPGNKSIVTNVIWIDYSTPLPENQTTKLRITANKVLLSDSTNVRWTFVYMYTNDNVVYHHTNIYGSDEMQISLPPARYYAYVTPNNVVKDKISETYNFVITNVGEIGNNIYRVKITPPMGKGIITNIQIISNRIKAKIDYLSDGTISIDYYLSNTNISSASYDYLTIVGYDNQDVDGFSGTWDVKAANSRTGIPDGLPGNPLDIGRSLALNFVLSPYNSQYFILDKELNTLEETNVVRFILNNTGEAGNDIEAVRIYLLSPFITNSVSVISSNGGILSKVSNDGSNFVELTYPAGKFTNNVIDRIELKIFDNLDMGEMSVTLPVKVKFSTSGLSYINSQLPTGETNLIYFKMPYPVCEEKLIPSEIYAEHGNFDLKLRFINKGGYRNNIERLKLYLPPSFTNNFSVSKIIDSIATNKSYNNGLITLYYTNFYPGVTNTITLQLTNRIKNIGTNFTFDAMVYNGFYETNVSGENILNIERAPAASIQSAYTNIYSVWNTNYINLEIDNGVASGSSALIYARIVIPDLYTNIIDVNSLKGQVISNDLTNLVIFYENGLLKGEKDVVSLNLLDKYDLVKTNVEWKVYVDNGNGYSTVNTNFSILKQNVLIPKVNITNLNALPTFYVGIETNEFTLILSNFSEGNNYAYSNVIELPDILNNVIYCSNSLSSSTISYSKISSRIVVSYSSGFWPYNVDKIFIRFTNSMSTATNFNLMIKAFNGSDDGPGIAYSKINFAGSDQVSEVYLSPSNQVLYSIDNEGDIKFTIQNNMQKKIKKAIISINTTILNVTNVCSTLFNKNLSFEKSSSNIIVDYENDGIAAKIGENPNSKDTLILSVTYTNTNNWTNTLTTKVMYEGGEEYFDTKVTTGESIDLPVLLADFGRVVGIVLPGSIKPQISIVGSDGKVVSNKNGEKAVGVANIDGTYKVDFVMPGTYRVQFSGSGYSVSNYIDGITVEANKITNIGLYKMKKAIFTPSAPYEQESLCLDDLGSVVIVPSGSLNDYFSLDIWLTNITVVSPAMKEAIDKSKTISKPAGNADNIRVYKFEMKGSSFDEREEQELKDEVIIKLKYNKSEVNSFGWNEDKLAVYYWRPVTKEWRRIGGVVDKNNSMVMFKAGYLHKYYAIMGDEAKGSTPGFVSVSVEPKIFTPTVGDRSFKNVKLSFSLEESVDKIEVKIYDLRGNLVKSYQLSGEYKNGEVYWDGKDFEGYPVKTGVYIYKILAGKNVYSGTVIIAK